MGGESKSGGSETSVVNTTPEWINNLGQSMGSGFQSAMTDYDNIKNPYSQYNSLFSDTTGQSYLDAFSAAPKAAYEQALSDTKDMFGANGLYGSVGNDMMSGAMASAGSQYANAMSQAQIAAQNAQLTDYNASAQSGLFDAQKAHQAVNNYLAGLNSTISPIMAGQQIITEENPGKGTGLMSGLGALGGTGLSAFQSMYTGGMA